MLVSFGPEIKWNFNLFQSLITWEVLEELCPEKLLEKYTDAMVSEPNLTILFWIKVGFTNVETCKPNKT